MLNDLLAACRNDPEREIYQIANGQKAGWYTCTYREAGKPMPLATQEEISHAVESKQIMVGKNPYTFIVCS